MGGYSLSTKLTSLQGMIFSGLTPVGQLTQELAGTEVTAPLSLRLIVLSNSSPEHLLLSVLTASPMLLSQLVTPPRCRLQSPLSL